MSQESDEGTRTVPVESWGGISDNPPGQHWDAAGKNHRTMPDEADYNRRLYGLTYRERYGREDRCIQLCKTPRRTPRNARCISCYGKTAVMSFADAAGQGLAPRRGPGRGTRLARWVGGLVGAALEGAAVPFQRSRDHQAALIRDLLQDAIGAGLAVEMTCDTCARPVRITPAPPAAAELEPPAAAELEPPAAAELEPPVEYAEDAL